LDFGFEFDLKWVDLYTIKMDLKPISKTDIKFFLEILQIPVSKLKEMHHVDYFIESRSEFWKDSEKQYYKSVGLI
jgi:hypothetical protein